MNRFLRNVYISKNNINLLRGRSREKVGLLREKGINLYTWVAWLVYFYSWGKCAIKKSIEDFVWPSGGEW